jgi:hypothetical protein
MAILFSFTNFVAKAAENYAETKSLELWLGRLALL